MGMDYQRVEPPSDSAWGSEGRTAQSAIAPIHKNEVPDTMELGPFSFAFRLLDLEDGPTHFLV